MSDRYIDFANSSIGHRLVGAMGLPSPVRLERWQAGRLRPVEGALLIGGGPLTANISAFANRLTDAIYSYGTEPSTATAWIPGHGPKLKAVVFDASDLVHTDELKQLREFFQPLMKNLDHSAHLVILGRAPQSLSDPFAASAQRALEGFSRSLAKELRSGGTLQLIYVGEGAEDQLEGPLRFFLSPKSAFVSGQVIRLNACDTPVTDWTRPLAGRKALVTGAARGIGASIAETLARDGADVVLLDVPPAKTDLEALAARLGGRSITLDICAEDAAAQLIEQLPDGIDIVVHNAGITRDKLLANMTPEKWDAVLAVNIAAQLRINDTLMRSPAFVDAPRIISLASTSGIAGNRGQTNYAASKAGVIGMVRPTGKLMAKVDGTANAVAPGFIETEMTARMPFATREVARRLSSVQQGGLPIDVAEAVAFLASPAAGGINGTVLRVCGQSMVGA